MTFKESLYKDLPTFLNVDEFATTHKLTVRGIDYDNVNCSVDKDIIDSANAKQATSSYDREGVFERQIKLFVKSVDIEKPVEGEQLYIDDEMYIVSNVSDNIGMLEIDLERNDY